MPAALLVAVDGPVTGLTRSLDSEHLSIGRDPEGWLCLDDPTVSRNHTLLEQVDGGWRITDLGSRNGTFVNSLLVGEQMLRHRDEIRIGASHFLFLEDDQEVLERAADEGMAESRFVTRSIVLTPSGSPFLETALLTAAAALGERHGRELDAIVRTSLALPSLGDTAAVVRCLLTGIFTILPHVRAAVLLLNEETGALEAPHGWWNADGACRTPAAPEPELRRAIEQSAAQLVESRGSAGSMLVAPLLSSSGCLGVIAVASGETVPFDSGHLEWLGALAVISAPALDNLRRIAWLESENQRLSGELNPRHNMVGDSPAIHDILRQVAKAAPAESTILIHGETGTGKELVARAIHAASCRSTRPFVAVNCATLSEHLLESDLFGHEKGAFTGAVAQKRGKLEVAEGGTLFLDEIGELALSLQAKLLRVLQEREFERVGGLRPIRCDIRLIAATNRNLADAVKSGAFRSDLFYRLHVIAIHIPPLRERRQDIPLLASFFLARIAAKTPRRIAGISAAARRRLAAYDWPGNVRELENAIERAAVLGASELIEPEDLPDSILERDAPECAGESRYHDLLSEAKKKLILAALDEAHGNQRDAARRLGLNPTYLSRLIRNLDLQPAARSGGDPPGRKPRPDASHDG
jgi:Nif-specific regulatory protein